jgi:hypothetical protein
VTDYMLTKKTFNRLAILSLLMAMASVLTIVIWVDQLYANGIVLSWYLLPIIANFNGIGAILIGVISLRKIKTKHLPGKGLTITGIVLGSLLEIITLCVIILYLLIIWFMSSPYYF